MSNQISRIRVTAKNFRNKQQRSQGEGARAPFYWPAEYTENTLFLALLRPIFCTKNGNSSPNGIRDENWSRTRCDIDQKKSLSARKKTFFFFGDHLNLNENQSKSRSRSLDVVSSLKKKPPNANSLLGT